MKMKQVSLKLREFYARLQLKLQEFMSGEEFSMQIKLIRFCGVFHSQPKKLRILEMLIQAFNFLASLYGLITLILFAYHNHSTVDGISESLCLIITLFMGMMKYYILVFNKDELLNMIEDLKTMNSRCMIKIKFLHKIW